LTPHLEHEGRHIGYGVRPSVRTGRACGVVPVVSTITVENRFSTSRITVTPETGTRRTTLGWGAARPSARGAAGAGTSIRTEKAV